MDSLEQMRVIAEQCPYFAPGRTPGVRSDISGGHQINCTMCAHYDEGKCRIKDEILSSIDQT